MNHEPIRISSLETVTTILERRPRINRLNLRRIDETCWEVTLNDEKRPNDLKRMADSAGRYSYERNNKRGFESIAGYDIDSDCQYRVIYRLPQEATQQPEPKSTCHEAP
jgi:hypothetical protein